VSRKANLRTRTTVGETLRHLKRILVPVDFSHFSKAAVEYGLQLAAISGAELILVHVVEHLSYPGDLIAPLLSKEFASDEQKHLLEKLRAYVRDGSVKCRPQIAFGRPWVEICKLARAKKCDLIVMSRRGSTHFLGSLLGSVAEKVVRHAPCAVLTINSKGRRG
jgi:universal stress protein A